MSEIDWSKAPVCAEAAIVAKPNNCHAPKTVYMREYSVNGCVIIGIDIDGKNISAMNDYWELVERPSSPAWNGEGLPPVGTVCEAAIPHTSGPDNERSFIWIEGRVIAYHEISGKTYAWFAEDDGFYPPNVLDFRPIRTPEQIAAEEREKAIDEMVGLMCQDGAFDHEDPEAAAAMGKLYDAGYRKTEAPK